MRSIAIGELFSTLLAGGVPAALGAAGAVPPQVVKGGQLQNDGRTNFDEHMQTERKSIVDAIGLQGHALSG